MLPDVAREVSVWLSVAVPVLESSVAIEVRIPVEVDVLVNREVAIEYRVSREVYAVGTVPEERVRVVV